MPPKLSRRRAPEVLDRIDEILAWETRHENERDTRFVELGGVGQTGAPPGAALQKCNRVAQSPATAKRGIPAGGGEGAGRQGQRTLGADLFQGLQEPDSGDRAFDLDASV